MAKIIISRPKKSEMCPIGYHVVRGHERICEDGTKTWVDQHIRKNRGRKKCISLRLYCFFIGIILKNTL